MAYQGNDGSAERELVRQQGYCDTDPTPTGGCSREYWAMGETLTQRRRVQEEGLRIVNCFYRWASRKAECKWWI